MKHIKLFEYFISESNKAEKDKKKIVKQINDLIKNQYDREEAIDSVLLDGGYFPETDDDYFDFVQSIKSDIISESNINEAFSRFSDMQAISVLQARNQYLEDLKKEWRSIGVNVNKFNWTDRSNPENARVPDSYKGIVADAEYMGNKIEILFSIKGHKFFLRGNEPGAYDMVGKGYTSLKAMDKDLKTTFQS